MKFFLSKINLTALALLLFALAGFGSCKKDDNIYNNINLRQAIAGKWEVTSFTIDGVEVMGAVILASKIELEACSDSKGDFVWKLNYADNSGENQTGDYEVTREGRAFELKSSDGDILKLDVDIAGDGLKLSGNLDGEHIVVKADRD